MVFVRILVLDTLYGRKFRRLLSFVFYLLSLLLTFINKKKADLLLMKSHCYCDSADFKKYLEPGIIKVIRHPAHVESLLPDVTVTKENIGRMLIMKPYLSPREKGVIMLEFSETFYKFYKYYDVERILRDYYLVLEPNWAGNCIPEIMLYAHLQCNPVIVEATDRMDFDFIGRLNSNLVPMDIGPGDWINPDLFYPIPNCEKKYDCCVVCVWADYKRHHVLLRALSRIRANKLSVVLVGASFNGMNSDKIKALVSYYGLQSQVTFMQDLSPDKVNLIYNESKVNLLLSYKEGGNKSLFEGLFANTPAILMKDNVGVNRDRINEKTGRIVSEEELPETLLMFSREYRKYNPREWALSNISCDRTTGKLNEKIRGLALENGDAWDEDIRGKFNTPWGMNYINGQDHISIDILDGYIRNGVSFK